MRKLLISVLSILVAGALLLSVYNLLLPIREANAKAELDAKLQTLLPGSSAFTPEEYTGDDTTIRAVYKGETGYVVQTQTAGYVGDIAMLIGVSNQGKVTGLQIRRMEETFGLGAEGLTNVDFLAQFLNSTGDAQVGENIDGLTGATVTSKAVARSVNAAVGFVTGADTSSGATSWGG